MAGPAAPSASPLNHTSLLPLRPLNNIQTTNFEMENNTQTTTLSSTDPTASNHAFRSARLSQWLDLLDPTANPTPPKSPFLSLPRELRDLVYTHCLVDNGSSTPSDPAQQGTIALPATTAESPTRSAKIYGTAWPFPTLAPNAKFPKPAGAGLLQACRQVRAEALPVYYGGNAFSCKSEDGFIAWLDVIGPEKRSLVKDIRDAGVEARTVGSLSGALGNVLSLESWFAEWGCGVEKGVVRVRVEGEGFLCEGEIREMISGIVERGEVEEGGI